MNNFNADRSVELPDHLMEGQKYRILEVKMRSGKTSAPDFLTESELIGLMEKHGIGTDASIATHINNIQVRNYVSIGSGRTLVPTALGVVLVHGYLRIDPGILHSSTVVSIDFNLCRCVHR
jgi:DNA topoisomerase-3